MFEAVFSDTILQDGPGKDLEPPGSLVDAYYLTHKGDQTTAASSNGQGIGGDKHFSKEKEVVFWNKLVPYNMHSLMTNSCRFLLLCEFFLIPCYTHHNLFLMNL